MTIEIGKKAPDFTLPRDGGGRVRLSDFRGKRVLIYFYPGDGTPGCTIESCGFRDTKEKFDKLNIEIIGISRDSVKSHDAFKARYKLNFILASDENGEVSKQYEVMNKNPLFGIRLFEVVRSTFLIDKKGNVEKIWRNVNSLFHIKNLLKDIQLLPPEAPRN